MLKIHILTLGAYQTNTYIIHEDAATGCCIIDPGYEPERILKTASDLGLSVEAILLTHGHFDHVGAVEKIVEATGCDLFISRHDRELPRNPIFIPFYPLTGRAFDRITLLDRDQEIRVGDLNFRVIATPGHTCGSVCYLCEDALFSGDTLFAGGCGRSDLPGGDYTTICRSLARLAELDDTLRVFPGHGESTVLAREKQYNPYMR